MFVTCLGKFGASGASGRFTPLQETVTRVARGILERLASGEDEATWPFACALPCNKGLVYTKKFNESSKIDRVYPSTTPWCFVL